MQEQQWLASVLPSQQQLDEVLGNDPAAALLGLAKSRAPIETGFVGDPGDDPELKKEFAIAQAAAAALKKNQIGNAHDRADPGASRVRAPARTAGAARRRRRDSGDSAVVGAAQDGA